jgi:hypothetical protein
LANAVQKIKLSPSRNIPFNKLVLSQSNVRRVKAGVSIEQLAESIAQRTLLQSLSVRAVVDTDGHETGMFEVPAGGRRYRALELLVKQKRMAKTQLVPCVVRDGGIAEDDSLAENDERVSMYPLDQLRAFQSLRDGEMSEEESAARHLVTPAIVKQRLRLASGFTKMDGVYAGADCVSTPWQARELALRLAREAEAVCRIYLSNGRRTGPLLAGRGCQEHPRPVHVRPVGRRRIRQEYGRKVDRRRYGRAWRSARRHSRDLWPGRFPRRRHRGTEIPEPATA